MILLIYLYEVFSVVDKSSVYFNRAKFTIYNTTKNMMLSIKSKLWELLLNFTHEFLDKVLVRKSLFDIEIFSITNISWYCKNCKNSFNKELINSTKTICKSYKSWRIFISVLEEFYHSFLIKFLTWFKSNFIVVNNLLLEDFNHLLLINNEWMFFIINSIKWCKYLIYFTSLNKRSKIGINKCNHTRWNIVTISIRICKDINSIKIQFFHIKRRSNTASKNCDKCFPFFVFHYLGKWAVDRIHYITSKEKECLGIFIACIGTRTACRVSLCKPKLFIAFTSIITANILVKVMLFKWIHSFSLWSLLDFTHFNSGFTVKLNCFNIFFKNLRITVKELIKSLISNFWNKRYKLCVTNFLFCITNKSNLSSGCKIYNHT